ncbi:MAG: patatin-like phospholipase family protein [Deltaproteobacteria bacterium]|nr:patatin-like phospholipase family protein [Deltaproteobacteria bacterium]
MTAVKIAFVASGGAARGLAHLGVLKACEELGLVPEIFVGTSAGALVGSMYGQDIPLDVLIDGYRLPWRRRHQGPRLHMATFLGAPSAEELLDPGHLASGLFSARKLEGYLRRHLPINDFRQLPKPVFVTAVDIDSGERVVFGPGSNELVPVSQAVAASCCVPGLFRPIEIGGRYYVDGEVARTLSADIAVEAGANVVIISNIYRPQRDRGSKRSLAQKGIHRVLRQSLSTLLTEKERRGVEVLEHRYPHVTFIDIAPDLGPYGYLNRFSARPLILRGYGTALRALASAKESRVFDRVLPGHESSPGLLASTETPRVRGLRSVG